jgi:hypothetical protein
MYFIVLRPHSQATNSSLLATSPSFLTLSKTALSLEITSSDLLLSSANSGFSFMVDVIRSSFINTFSKGLFSSSSSSVSFKTLLAL